MLYVLLGDHSAETCPTSNSTTREAMLKGAPEIPNLAKKLGVKIVAGPFVNHEDLIVMIVEAEKAEAVNQFLTDSGLAQWNKVRTLPSLSIEEGMKEINRLKPIF
jgi:hypothetical protein